VVFAALGGFAYHRRWWVLAAWAAVLVAGIALSPGLFDRLATVDSLSPQAESAVAEDRIRALISDGPIVYAVVAGRDVYDPGLVASVSNVSEGLRTVDGVADVDDLYTSPGGRIGADNHSTLVWVELQENLPVERQETAEDLVRARLKTIDAPTVIVGGDHLAERAFGEQAVRDLAVGETIAFVALLVALVVIFGGVFAASIPLTVALVGVSATLLALLGLTNMTTVSDYSLNIVTLLGLGLAVDYALLIVARYREERAGGAGPPHAVETAMARAGHAVAISGLAVAAALAGLTLFAEPLLASMALGGSAVVLLTTALALTGVPALIAVAGDRIPPAGASTWVTRAIAAVRGLLPHRKAAPRERPKGSTGARRTVAAARPKLLARLAGFAQRNPGPVAAAATVGLLLLAAPVLGANFANSDARALPGSLEERRAYDSYQSLFGAHQAAPVTVVAEVDAASPQLRDYLNHLLQLPHVARLDTRPDVPEGTTIIDLTPEGGTAATPSRDLVRVVRATNPGFPVAITGEAAKAVDYQESVASRLPYAILAVVLAMFVLLFALTGSVVVPIKALLLNALTFVATLGVLIVVFQWGWGEPVLRFESWGALDLTTPLLLFVFIFGLSMDYEVFLLARIKEEYDRRPDNDLAVLTGITRSGPVVTAAALCITIVFLGFAAGGLVAVKEIGVGMAVAVLLDVTVVRGLLLPATMSLLGDLNWWAPSWLGRLRQPVGAASVG
jgi:RND superfamily putative drug exporter